MKQRRGDDVKSRGLYSGYVRGYVGIGRRDYCEVVDQNLGARDRGIKAEGAAWRL